jgi:selenocysteine lyase/cysteine desulfurase
LAALIERARPAAFVTLHASNVCGVAQDVAALGEVCRRRGVWFVLDAAQSAGSLPLDAAAMHIDALCLAGHKSLFGPTGIGALALSERAAERMQPLIRGGTGSQSDRETMPDFLPDCLEAGTPNTFGAAGLLAGVRWLATRTVEAVAREERARRDRLVERLRGISGVRIFGDDPGPAAAVVSIATPLAPSDLAQLLDARYGLAVRAGLHCAPRAHRFFGTFPAGTVRLAPGLFTPPAAIDEAADAIAEILRSAP